MKRLTVVTVVLMAVACGPTDKPGSVALPITPVRLPELDQGQIARGRQVYTRNCATCHGANADGAANWALSDTSGNLPPPPQNDKGHTWRHGDEQLWEIIRNGMRDPFNRSPDLTMPPFNERLSDEEVGDVIVYFKSLWSFEHRAFQQAQNERPAPPMPEGIQ